MTNSPAGSAREAQSAEPREITRNRVREILRGGRAIQTPRGIDELSEIDIGGIKQWISVRGRDRRNPILLFIHGGPGTTEMPVSWFYQTPLEDYFTVVQWDQRGSGKTASSNEQADVLPTITVERMVNDTEEMVSYLCQQFGKNKLFVLGHSWGTVLGLEVALRHPGRVHAYIGMGQVINWRENESVGYQFAIEEARRRQDERAIRELEAIAPYPPEMGTSSVQDTLVQRRWVAAYGGMIRGREDLASEDDLRVLSPDYSNEDLSADSEIMNVVEHLLPQLEGLDYRVVTELGVPVFLFSGRHDYAVPSEVSRKWFERLEAPTKKIVWFEHSAHMVHLEQPGRFVYHLIRDVRPTAVRDGDAAPQDGPGTGLTGLDV